MIPNITHIKNKEIDKDIVRLTNKKTGENCKFMLRVFRPGDEQGIIEVVREEHGDTYFKKWFYDRDLLRKTATDPEYVVFVAQRRRKIVGIEILRIFAENGDDYIEPASQIIKLEYRGFDLARALVNYTFEVAIKLKPSALFVHAAMYHSITQHVCESYGMVPVGFEIASFLTDEMENTFDMKEIRKYSAGSMCYPVEKHDAKTVYLPDELSSYSKERYEKLGVTVKIVKESEYDGDKSIKNDLSECIISHDNDLNRYITIDVRTAGKDLTDIIKNEMKEHTDLEKNPDAWTYFVLINTDTPDFYSHYENLKKLGFFFAGLQPVCGEHERAFMYWVGDLDLKMDFYVTTESFDAVRNSIQKFYHNRVSVKER